MMPRVEQSGGEVETIDIAIIGGGPAGLAAALYAARAQRRTVVFERAVTGGQIALANVVENYPGSFGTDNGINGFDLAQTMQKQAERYGAEMRWEALSTLERLDEGFRLQAAGRPIVARAVIVTAGAESRRLDVPGENRLTGRGVSYCATCDAALHRNQDVAVVGGGDAALDEGLFVARFAAKVHLIHRRDTFRGGRLLQGRVAAEPKIDVIWNTVVEEIEGEEEVRSVHLRNVLTGDSSRIDVQAVFIFIGHTPGSTLVAGLTPTNPHGHVQVDLWMQTAVPGLFAAGDVRIGSARQAVTAAGDGATAAIAADRYLSEQYPELSAGYPNSDQRLVHDAPAY